MVSIEKFKPYTLNANNLHQSQKEKHYNIGTDNRTKKNNDLYYGIKQAVSNAEEEIKYLTKYVTSQDKSIKDLKADINMSKVQLEVYKSRNQEQEASFLNMKINQLEKELEQLVNKHEIDTELLGAKKGSLAYNKDELSRMEAPEDLITQFVDAIAKELTVINEYKVRFEESLFIIASNLTKLNFHNGEKDYYRIPHISQEIFPAHDKRVDTINSFIDKLNQDLKKYKIEVNND